MRDRERLGGDIVERLIDLGAAVIRFVDALPKRAVTRHIGIQLVRSTTSAGANYEEARRAESRADFIHKIGLASKELGEALYWLRLVQRLDLLHDAKMMRETDELIAILVASARTARGH
jgi:four helix bundle protein